MAQYNMWEYLQNDPKTVNSNSLLQEFMDSAALSRYAYLTAIENYLAWGQRDSAQALLDNAADGKLYAYPSVSKDGVTVTDYSKADEIVNNYLSFYQLALNYADSSLSGTDSGEIVMLANLCPFSNGAVVYRARGLYTLVYNELGNWNDDSVCGSGDYGKRSAGNNGQQGNLPTIRNLNAGRQSFSIYPNPNNGQMSVLQRIPDNEPASMEIWSAEGKSIYRQTINFSGGKAQINLNGIAPGLYMLQIRSSKGESYTAKFIVN